MIMARRWLMALATLVLTFAAMPATAAPSLTRFVDPFIGTDGTGHTSPAASRPFAMVAPGPDNADNGWDYTSGYQYRAPTILGFSQTRASGTGIPELGDILLMPMQTLRTTDFSSHYDKASETARPGYYSVKLTDNDVRVDLTSTPRVALHRYRFGKGGRVWVLADFQHGLRFLTKERVTASDVTLGTDGIEGSIASRNWTDRTVAFSLRFDHPIATSRQLPAAAGDKAPRYLLAFDLGPDATLHAKVALSTTDIDGARRNRAELPGWDFDAVASAASAEWEALLDRARIDADDRSKRIFYTALYHAFLHPSVISDVDGRYRGGNGKIAQARGKAYYSTLSLWDTFRAAQPLYTLLVPERIDDIVLTLLDHHKAVGTLPLWPIWGGETNTMIGNPALPVIADAWAKGFRGFDGREALAAMVTTSTRDHAHSDWSLFDRFGYYPFDLVENEAVSRTLEAGIGDAATAHMAGILGDTVSAERFGTRAKAYRTLIDPETGLARGRDSKGQWRTPFDPGLVTSPLGHPGDYTEANAWQYSWTPALHDATGLITAMGGKPAFTAMLDRFFSVAGKIDKFQGQEALIGQYSHGNEPGHHIPWLYAFSTAPEKGPALIRRIAADFYKDTPDGITGNEDAGQMSAWLIFATLGFYPVDPASGHYAASLPLVARAEIRIPGREPLTIISRGDGDRLTSLTLKRIRLDPLAIPHEALTAGGILTFERSGRAE
jgi:predicted alpha-1,2-mannosidase